MLNFGNKEFRNLQEQVGKNQDDILKLKQSLGGALPDPIEGPEGPEGPQGEVGPQGERGTGLFGTSENLPSATAYKEGDMYLLNSGLVYKKVAHKWLLQTDLKGPQGLIGPIGTNVVANPVGEPQDDLNSIEIDGVVYEIQPPLSPESLSEVLEGSETVIVDTNVEGDKLQVRLDNDVTNKLDRALVTPLATPTEKVLVGVDTGNSQIQVKIGSGLQLQGATSPYTLAALGVGSVTSVNGETGDVVLTASDINATNSQSVQENLERIDERLDDAPQLSEDNTYTGDQKIESYDSQTDRRRFSYFSYDSISINDINGDIGADVDINSSFALQRDSFIYQVPSRNIAIEVNYENIADKTAANIWTQTQTINVPNNTDAISIGGAFIAKDGNGKLHIGQANNSFKFYDTHVRFDGPSLRPQINNSSDLGELGTKWKNGYFSGQVNTGTIKIGDTILTEAQLIALLALLN